jgi:hypothetical protein
MDSGVTTRDAQPRRGSRRLSAASSKRSAICQLAVEDTRLMAEKEYLELEAHPRAAADEEDIEEPNGRNCK